MRQIQLWLCVLGALLGPKAPGAVPCEVALSNVSFGPAALLHIGTDKVSRALARYRMDDGSIGLSEVQFRREVQLTVAHMLGVTHPEDYSNSLLFRQARPGQAFRYDYERFFERADNDLDRLALQAALNQAIRDHLANVRYRGSDAEGLTAISAAKELVISTHQISSLQNEMPEYFKAHPELQGLPLLVLASPVETPVSSTLRNQASRVALSDGGEIAEVIVKVNGQLIIPMAPETIHVMGGYCDSCLLRTIQDAAELTLSERESVTVIVHPKMSFMNLGTEVLSVAEVLKKRPQHMLDWAREGGVTVGEKTEPWDAFLTLQTSELSQMLDPDYAFRGRQGVDTLLYENEDGYQLKVRYIKP